MIISDPAFLGFLAVLAAAAGADLALTILVLGLAPRMGWSGPPGDLMLLESVPVALSVLALYLAEAAMERFPGTFALWHIFQRWVRLLGIFLLASLATAGLPLLERGVLVAGVVLLGMSVYLGTSGWQGLLSLRNAPARSRLLAALAMDVSLAALLVLALEEPLQALMGLGALLVLGTSRAPLTLRAHRAVIQAGRGWLRALLAPGGWDQLEKGPRWVRESVASLAPSMGSFRATPAVLLDRGIRRGWLVATSGGEALFVPRGDAAMRLERRAANASSSRDPLHTRVPVRFPGGEGEILVSRDGPGVEELEGAIPLS